MFMISRVFSYLLRKLFEMAEMLEFFQEKSHNQVKTNEKREDLK